VLKLLAASEDNSGENDGSGGTKMPLKSPSEVGAAESGEEGNGPGGVKIQGNPSSQMTPVDSEDGAETRVMESLEEVSVVKPRS